MLTLGDKLESKSPVLRIHLLGGSDRVRQDTKEVLAEVKDPLLDVVDVNSVQLSETSEQPDVTMVILDDEGDARSLALLQSQSTREVRPALFALVSGRSRDLMKRALHAGADELLFLPMDMGDAVRALLKVSENKRRNERVTGGSIYAVTSLSGGAGVSTTSVNLALAMRYSLDRRVGLVDLDLQNAGLNVLLHVEPEHTVSKLAETNIKLDSLRLEGVLTKHPSGVYLLAAPKRIEDSEAVTDVTIGAVADLMRQLFDVVIVDCGRHIDERTVAVWERADELLYVLDQSLTSAHCASRFSSLFERLDITGLEPRFILNKFDSQSPITEERIAETVGSSIYAKIPKSTQVLEKVELRAQDLWQVARGCQLARSTEDLARRLSARPELVTDGSNGFVARLLSAIGARA